MIGVLKILSNFINSNHGVSDRKMGPKNKRYRPFGSFKLGSYGIESELHYSAACMQC